MPRGQALAERHTSFFPLLSLDTLRHLALFLHAAPDTVAREMERLWPLGERLDQTATIQLCAALQALRGTRGEDAVAVYRCFEARIKDVELRPNELASTLKPRIAAVAAWEGCEAARSWLEELVARADEYQDGYNVDGFVLLQLAGVELCQRRFEPDPGLVEIGNLVLTHPVSWPWFPRAGTRAVSSPLSPPPRSWPAAPGCRRGACP